MSEQCAKPSPAKSEETFFNPYDGLPQDAIHRTMIDISREDLSYINRLYTKRGVLQTTLSILFKRLIHELKHNGFNEFDPGGYQRAVAGLTVNLGGFTKVLTGTDLTPTSADTGESINLGKRSPVERSGGTESIPAKEVSQGHDGPRVARVVRARKRASKQSADSDKLS